MCHRNLERNFDFECGSLFHRIKVCVHSSSSPPESLQKSKGNFEEFIFDALHTSFPQAIQPYFYSKALNHCITLYKHYFESLYF